MVVVIQEPVDAGRRCLALLMTLIRTAAPWRALAQKTLSSTRLPPPLPHLLNRNRPQTGLKTRRAFWRDSSIFSLLFDRSKPAGMTAPLSPGKPLAFDDGPLVWIDLEMTGLQPGYDKILEVAVSRGRLSANTSDDTKKPRC